MVSISCQGCLHQIPSRQKVTDALRTVHESSSGCIKVLDFHQIYISICQERCTFTASFACTTYVEKKKNKKCVGCLGRISLRRVYTCLLTVWRFVRPFRGLSWIAVPLLTRAASIFFIAVVSDACAWACQSIISQEYLVWDLMIFQYI